MNRLADFDLSLGCQAGGQAHHLCAVGLHWEIPQRAGVRIALGPDMPPEPRVQFTVQHGVVDDGVRPGPERPIYLMVSPQQFSREGTRQADSLRQSPFALAVLGTENALFA